MIDNAVTVIIVNLLTLDRTRTCYESLRRYYPSVPVILVDNGSQDDSTEYIEALGQQPSVTAIINTRNRGHGPALHQGTQEARTRYVFTLDSDCEIRQGGFLEPMLSRFKGDPTLFALGQSGVAYTSPVWAMMFDREMYLALNKPFMHHGSPANRLLGFARKQGYRCDFDYPLTDYIAHAGMGTRRLFGGDGYAWRPTPKMIKEVREKRRAK